MSLKRLSGPASLPQICSSLIPSVCCCWHEAKYFSPFLQAQGWLMGGVGGSPGPGVVLLSRNAVLRACLDLQLSTPLCTPCNATLCKHLRKEDSLSAAAPPPPPQLTRLVCFTEQLWQHYHSHVPLYLPGKGSQRVRAITGHLSYTFWMMEKLHSQVGL